MTYTKVDYQLISCGYTAIHEFMSRLLYGCQYLWIYVYQYLVQLVLSSVELLSEGEAVNVVSVIQTGHCRVYKNVADVQPPARVGGVTH